MAFDQHLSSLKPSRGFAATVLLGPNTLTALAIVFSHCFTRGTEYGVTSVWWLLDVHG